MEKEKIKEAVKQYDFLKELFPNLDKFLEDYDKLHKQLKKGDKLEIKVETAQIEAKYEARYLIPNIRAYLVTKQGTRKRVIDLDSYEIQYSPILYEEEFRKEEKNLQKKYHIDQV